MTGYNPQALEREVWGEVFDFLEAAGDQRSITSGGDDDWFGMEFLAQVVENFPDEAAVSVDGAGQHGFLGGFADGMFRLFELDVGEQGGAACEALGHGCKAGGDNASLVGGVWSLHSLTVVRWGLRSSRPLGGRTVVCWGLHFIGFVRWLVWGNDIEGDGGAEVDYDAGAAVESVGTDGVGQAVGADLFRFGVIDPDGQFTEVAELMAGFWAEP